LLQVTGEAPGKTIVHLPPVRIYAVANNVCERAIVAVNIDLLELNRLPLAHIDQVATRDL